MKKLSKLKNIGQKSEQWLNAIGVHSLTDLRDMGAIDCCIILKAQGYPVSLNLAYAIEGALRDIHWTKIPADTKQSLKNALNANK
jgi:DNA transformation protein and related proteins